MDSEWVITVLVALAAAVLIGIAIWVLNGPNRRRVADLEQRLEASRRRSGLGPAHEAGGTADTADTADTAAEAVTGGDDATVIELRPRAAERTIEHLKHELAVVRDELLRWRAMSDDFERRWRAELEVSDELRRDLAERDAVELDVRRSLGDVRSTLERLVDDGLDEGVADSAGPTDGPEVIDLRDRRSHLEDRLQRLEADLDAVRRDLDVDED